MKNLKGAVNFERARLKSYKTHDNKVKQFNDLPYLERQKLSNEKKGYRQSLPFLTDWQKVEIINNKKL